MYDHVDNTILPPYICKVSVMEEQFLWAMVLMMSAAAFYSDDPCFKRRQKSKEKGNRDLKVKIWSCGYG